MNSSILDGEDDSFFEQILPRSWQQPLLLDFWAGWCAPCRAMLPVLERLADELAGRLLVVKINAETSLHLCEHFGVRGLPAVLLVYKGQEQARFDRALPESDIRRFLAPFVQHPLADQLQEVGHWLASGEQQQALVRLRELVIQHPQDSEVLYRLVNALLMLSSGQDEAGQWLQAASADVLRDPRLQQLWHRWSLSRHSGSLEQASVQFAAYPDVVNRLRLARALSARSRDSEAMSLLLEVLETRDATAAERQPCQQLLIELINTCPDRALAQRFRRRWLQGSDARG